LGVLEDLDPGYFLSKMALAPLKEFLAMAIVAISMAIRSNVTFLMNESVIVNSFYISEMTYFLSSGTYSLTQFSSARVKRFYFI